MKKLVLIIALLFSYIVQAQEIIEKESFKVYINKTEKVVFFNEDEAELYCKEYALANPNDKVELVRGFTLYDYILIDVDGDGFSVENDCDDNNASINPNAQEILYDNIDNDCNPQTLDYLDADEDSFNSNIDCDDNNPEVNPNQTEIIGNGIDDDCNPDTPDLIINTDTYVFYPSEWGIEQGGAVNENTALQNRLKVNEAVQYAKDEGYSVFEMGAIDFFIKCDAVAFGNSVVRESIIIPSNFHIKMSDETHIRVYPNDQPASAIFGARFKKNIKITGGHLHGDRWVHNYDPNVTYSMHDSGFAITLIGVQGVVVEGVSTYDVSGDGIFIHSWGRRNADGSVPQGEEDNYTDNVVIRGNKFYRSRRNGIGAADMTNFIIEDNLFVESGSSPETGISQGSGQAPYTSEGIIPGNGIDFEAWRQYDENGAYHTQFINNGIVRNNKFINGQRADVNLFTCSGLEIYGNEFEKGVSNKASFNIKIYNNIFNAPEGYDGNAVSIKSFIRSGTGLDENYNHKVYNNVMTGYEDAIVADGTDGEFYGNEIIDFTRYAIYLGGAGKNNYCHNNIFRTSVNGAKAYFNVGSPDKSGSIIENETFDFPNSEAIYLRGIDNETSPMIIRNIDFKGKTIRLNNSHNFILENLTNYNLRLQNGSSNIVENE